jgi:rhodanese-related sulfurtransferase
MTDAVELKRIPRREQPSMVPRALGDGRYEVDATWGSVQPIELTPGVRTVGELEVIEHLETGRALIDTRLEHFYRDATIPGARWLCHETILAHRDELVPEVPTVFFCNGPQCKATPDAIAQLLDDDYPAASILYYRGGMHDWLTLGYPTVAGART